MLLIVALWLAAPEVAALSQASGADQSRGVLDVLVFYADPPRDLESYPSQVRQELERFVRRYRAYRPRPRPAQLGSEMRMVYAAREGHEAKLFAAASDDGVGKLAQVYVEDLRPCYEWEGFHDCPQREAEFAERYLASHPENPFGEILWLFVAHRWLCAAEGYQQEQRPIDAARARRAYESGLTTAIARSRSALMQTALAELRASGRCYASDPFAGRRKESP